VTSSSSADVVVIGGGLIGTAVAWRLAQTGLGVAIVTGERGAAASHVAAGMLAPVTEITFTEKTLLRLSLASRERFDAFAAELEDVTGKPSGLRRQPTLSVATSADDDARLRVLADYLERLELTFERLTGRECRKAEPLLAPGLRSGLLVDGDWSCDNRELWQALQAAAAGIGVREIAGFAHGVDSTDGRVRGVTLADGTSITTDRVVLANGAWAAQISGIAPVPVRPVKGQILRLDPGPQPQPSRTVRAFTSGSEIYLVPRDSGHELVLGATVEERGFDASVTAGGVYELLRDARSVLPMTAEYGLAETSVGWRPGTPDNAPIIGPGEPDGLLLATGHFRNGVLLTPVTADLVAEFVTTGRVPELAEPFGIDRFSRANHTLTKEPVG
jgi:glycine oxidase